jgi:hypothetical protein
VFHLVLFRGEIRATYTFEPVFLTSLTILFNNLIVRHPNLPRSCNDPQESHHPNRLPQYGGTSHAVWGYIQTQLKLPFDGYQKLTLMIKMELENVTDVVPKDDYEFQMNVSRRQSEEQV